MPSHNNIYQITLISIDSEKCLTVKPALSATDPRIPALHNAPLFTSNQTVSNIEGAYTNAETGEAPPTSDLPVFPVMVFSHGLGAMSLTYSGICADVASHGYVVASVEHRWVLFELHDLICVSCHSTYYQLITICCVQLKIGLLVRE